MTEPASTVTASTASAKAAKLVSLLSPHEWKQRRRRLDLVLALCAVTNLVAVFYPLVKGKESGMLENLGLTAMMTAAALVANYIWGAKSDDNARTATLADMLKARGPRGGV